MRYDNMFEGVFRSRPNRFLAEVEIEGTICICHVKNTGRCKELLTEGARVLVQKADAPQRKTAYDLIAVYKGDILINMDSQAPNKVVMEWLNRGGYFENITHIKPECRYQNSRFDFYVEADGKKHFMEVKGVTLEQDGVLKFPDAPTERGVKHIRELMEALEAGYGGHILFVAQMEPCDYFVPNEETHPEFAHVLRQAEAQGVKVCCVNCTVTEESLEILDFVPVRLMRS